MAKFGSPEHRIERAQARLKQAQADAAMARQELAELAGESGGDDDLGISASDLAWLNSLTPAERAKLDAEIRAEIDADMAALAKEEPKPTTKPQPPKVEPKPPAPYPLAGKFVVTRAQLRDAKWKYANQAAYKQALKDQTFQLVD